MSQFKRKRTEIMIETRSVTVCRTSGRTSAAYCEVCRKTVTAFAPAQIAAFLQVEPAEVGRRITESELHLTEIGSGGGLVCGNSLAEILRGINL